MPILIKAITLIFINNDNDCSYGRNTDTAYLFNPLRGEVIVLIATLTQHAIGEYEYGQKKVQAFDGSERESKFVSI